MPWADFSYFPMNINLLYILPLIFKNDILPKFIHMAFGLGTGWLVFSYLKRRYDAVWGLLGFAIFFTTPIVVWLSTSAYIDLGMTFFTTASVLAFVKWREAAYDNNLWFLVSACAMGLAVGSKYNALIAWFITNLLIMVIYTRDEDSQLSALKYGFFFFLVTAITASPWYVKNYLLTDNPFYPMFKSFFRSIQSDASVSEIVRHVEKGSSGSIGFFKMRGLMFGESFWETLSIPIRMFFQGDDNSYQYFQGRLNPILLVFLPFSFMKKENRKNNLLFLGFSMFFMFMAYFLTAKQVRYQLPVLPFLSILSVVGIRNVYDVIKNNKSDKALLKGKSFLSIMGIVLFLSVALLLAKNVQYLNERMNIIKPLPYILKTESKDEFLSRHLRHYDAVRFMNAHLPKNAKIYTIYFGRRGYYLERDYMNHPSFGTNVLKKWVSVSKDEEKFLQMTDALGATHIAMRTDLAEAYLNTNYSVEEVTRFISLAKKHWQMLYNVNNYSVWEIKRGNQAE